MEEVMRSLAPLTLTLLCVLVSQLGQAQGPDLPEASTPSKLGLAAALSTEGANRHGLAATERCAEAPVDVAGTSADERWLACSAASEAIQLLSRCRISLRRPLHVQIVTEVRHPFGGGAIFGLFNPKQERVLVTQEANVASLAEGTPYATLPQHDFYRSVIVHEVVHGIMHQNLKRPAATNAAYEYPAYALQIESLAADVREKFLRSFDQAAIVQNTVFNDSVLLFDPYFFAARAYHHFKASADGCAHLTALLEGEVDFIAPPQM
jgi:hypothetical protein